MHAFDYYLMTTAGECVHTKSIDKVSAFVKAAQLLDYDFDDFLDNINIVEWKDSENRIVESYSEGRTQTIRFPIYSEYQLKDYVNIIKPENHEIQVIEK